MKRASRRTPPPRPDSVDMVRSYMQATSDDYQRSWHSELTGDTPYWVHLLVLHLRMVELEHLEATVEELL